MSVLCQTTRRLPLCPYNKVNLRFSLITEVIIYSHALTNQMLFNKPVYGICRRRQECHRERASNAPRDLARITRRYLRVTLTYVEYLTIAFLLNVNILKLIPTIYCFSRVFTVKLEGKMKQLWSITLS